MNEKALLFAIACLAGCDASSERGAQESAGSGRPNVVVILTDDQRADTLGVTGHPFLQTPNLDRIASQGALFDQAFVVTPVCAPSRATLLTGLYPHRSGVSDNGGDIAYGEVPTLPEMLRQAGYATAFVGKYHLGADGTPRPGFEHWVAYDNNGAQGTYFDSPLIVDGRQASIAGYSTDVLGDFAVSWLQRQGTRPFFLLLSLKNPHVPLEPAPQDRGLFREVDPPLPAGFHDPDDRMPVVVGRATSGGESRLAGPDGERDVETMAEIQREYARMIPSIDRLAGRIYDTLQDMGVLDATMLIFTSDNGRLLGEHGLIRKRSPYDPSIRVPLIIRLPDRIVAGTRLSRQVLNLDLAPTILDLAGLDVPAELSGRSLMRLFADPDASWRQDWLCMGAFPAGAQPPYFAVRGPRWKYIRYTGDASAEQLFDLHADPDERQNLVDARPLEAARMRARMEELMTLEQVPQGWRD